MHEAGETLLRFLYQMPVAVIQVQADGTIGMINPVAAQMLMPLSPDGQLENVFRVLSAWLPGLEEEFSAQPKPGPVFTNRTLEVGGERSQVYSVTLNRLDAVSGVLVIQDITEREQYRAEMEAQKTQADFLRGRQEAASAVLHDIGNAVTSLGVSAAELFPEENWRETDLLQRTDRFLSSLDETLRHEIGGEKTQALHTMLEQIVQQLGQRKNRIQQTATRLNQGLHHIEEILSIQRRQSSHGHTRHGQFSFADLIRDSLSMVQAQLERRGIEVALDLAQGLRPLSGDPTRITRVILNLLRNAMEAFDRMTALPERPSLDMVLYEENGLQIMTLRDNATGFSEEEAGRLFQAGVSGKEDPSGIGLFSCRKIVKDEGGSLQLNSDGPGTGAVAILSLPEKTKDTPTNE